MIQRPELPPNEIEVSNCKDFEALVQASQRSAHLDKQVIFEDIESTIRSLNNDQFRAFGAVIYAVNRSRTDYV
jgi:hypothetical protein